MTDEQIQAKIELERRRRARQQHNGTWLRLRDNLFQPEVGRLRGTLRSGWASIRDDETLEIPAAWLAESLRRLTMPSFRQECPDVAEWKISGAPRVSGSFLRGFDQYVIRQGFGCGIYDWGDPPDRGPQPADLSALAEGGGGRAVAAVEWVRDQMHPYD
jgi:hypothetical protein